MESLNGRAEALARDTELLLIAHRPRSRLRLVTCTILGSGEDRAALVDEPRRRSGDRWISEPLSLPDLRRRLGISNAWVRSAAIAVMLMAALPLLAVLAAYQWLREHVLIPLHDAWNRLRNEPRTIWRMTRLALLIATVIAADANFAAAPPAFSPCSGRASVLRRAGRCAAASTTPHLRGVRTPVSMRAKSGSELCVCV